VAWFYSALDILSGRLLRDGIHVFPVPRWLALSVPRAGFEDSPPRKLHFASSDKVIELVQRGGGLKDQESRLMLNQALATGRGGLFLNLTAEQFSKLKHSGK